MKFILQSLLFLFLSFWSISAWAQQLNSKVSNPEMVESPKAKLGTYQFIYYTSKLKYVFADEVLKKIEKNRDKKETVYLKLNPAVDVMILPKDYIESAAFIPLPETKQVD